MDRKLTYEELEQRVRKLEEEATEYKQTEQALRESENKYRTLLENIPQKIFHKDRHSVYVSCNENYARDLMIKPEDIAGKTDHDFFPKELAEKYRKDDTRIIEAGKTEYIEEKYLQDGKEIFVQTVKTPIKDKEGHITGLLGIFWDITHQKEAAEALQKAHDELEQRVEERTAELIKANQKLKQEIEERKRTEEALRESENKYHNLYDNAPDMYVSVDAKTAKIVECNQTLIDRLCYTREEIIGRPILDMYSPDSAEYSRRKMFPEFVKTGEIEVEELQLQRKDGTTVNVYLKASAVRNPEGKILYSISSWRDISEKKKLEVQLQHAQKLESIGTLAGGIAHDFNNLLMGIQGNASLMLLNIDSSHQFYERLKNIEKQVESGARLTSHLLGYARKGKYEIKPVDLNQLVKEASDTLGRTRKEVTIHQEFAEGLLAIEADSGQIEQVLLNLFVNAADAMPGGGDLILKTMNVTHEHMTGKVYDPKPGKYVMLTVTDTGMGMDKETMERIFDPFFTTKEMGRGTGLGLASAYGIIKGHGGYIDVESDKGYGTTFKIYLPASEKEVPKVITTAEEIIEGTGTALLVDDEDVVLEVGQDLLEAMGYRVLIARDGKEAIEVYEKNRDDIDIVVLDMVMPNMGGGKAYDRMRKINPDIKVLLSSGYSIDGEATEILERGCNAFIQKPFRMKDLSQAIRKILEKK